jgi:hypothetical protein
MKLYAILLKWYAGFCYGWSEYHYDKLRIAKFCLDPSDIILFHEKKCDKWWDRWEKAINKSNEIYEN